MDCKEIVNAVNKYIGDEEAKYAILIDGVWGSGKTYLYENYLVDAIESKEIGKEKNKQNVYISLYGISTIDSLAKQLVINYLVYVKVNGGKVAKKIMKSLSGFISAVSNAFSISVHALSVDFSKMNNLCNEINVKDMVICLDDLERCAIPINELFGFVNNLIEHCNCKVIILADEKNIGKIYANTNLEQKYTTILTGTRKVVEYIENGEKSRVKKGELGKNPDGEITIEELKELNELLYSENYLYKDIKEKVIGKTLFYYPKLSGVIEELLNGNGKTSKGIIQDGLYKTYLMEHIENIVSAFNETGNRNLRIAKTWIFLFRKIYDSVTEFFAKDKYYNDILQEFLRYSIWVAGALKMNKKLTQITSYANQEYVCFENHRYTRILRYGFIDAWICQDVWDDKELTKACRLIIKRKQQESMKNPPKIYSTGEQLGRLNKWMLMNDEQVKEVLLRLEYEIKEGKYAYYDYSNILLWLLFLKKEGLYGGDINHIKDVMIDLIQKDSFVQEESEYQKNFDTDEMKNSYTELYTPIAQARKIRNHELNKEDQEDFGIYSTADAFYEYCRDKESYFSRHRSFVGYLDLEKLYRLLNVSDNDGVYTIQDAFKSVYCMGNLKEFYADDKEKLEEFRKNIVDNKIVKQDGITRKIALNSLAEMITKKLLLLGAEEQI